MEPREQIETLQGKARLDSRPITSEERGELRAHAKKARIKGWWGKLGCPLAVVLFVGFGALLSTMFGGSGPMILGTMLTGFVSIAWVLLSARDARHQARLRQMDARARTVESYEVEGHAIEALDSTGRVTRLDASKPESVYLTRRIVGLPHRLIQDDRTPGPRRLSATELEEVDRLIDLTRRRPDYLEVFLYAMCGFLLLTYSAIPSVRNAPNSAILPALFLFALSGKIVERGRLLRFRRALRDGKLEGQVVAFLHEGRHIEVLGGKILWTVEGQPSRTRTRWTP